MWGLDKQEIDQIKFILNKNPKVKKIIIYGSRAMGTHRPGSDIDLTLVGSDLTLKDQNSLATELDDLLLPYLFDLSLYHHISNPDLLDHIKRQGKEF